MTSRRMREKERKKKGTRERATGKAHDGHEHTRSSGADNCIKRGTQRKEVRKKERRKLNCLGG